MTEVDSLSRERSLGTIYLVISAVCYSLAGLFTLLITTDVWTMLCIRGFVAGVFILMLLVIKGELHSLKSMPALKTWPGLLAVFASAAAMFFNLSAYRNTEVANVVLIYSTAPFVAAALAYLILGEKSSRRTLIASGIAVVGALILVSGSIGNGGLKGDFYALIMTFFMALMIVAVRWGKSLPMVQMACVSAFLSCVLTFPFASFETVDTKNLTYLVLFGILQLGLGLVFLTLGSQRVSPGKSALISALDVPLAPLWVWIVFSAVPPTQTFIGGLVIMVAVFSLMVNNQEDKS